MRKKIFINDKHVGFCLKPTIENGFVVCDLAMFTGIDMKMLHPLFKHLGRLKLKIESIEGEWYFHSSPAFFHQPGLVVVSNYGPASPISEGMVQFEAA
jgi:hypothetical protein